MGELTEVLAEITELLRQYLPLEEEKLKAVKENKVSIVEDCMLKEQALLLKMKGLDRKREDILKEKGCEGMTLKEVIHRLGEEEKRKAQPVFDEFALIVQNFNSLNEESMKLIRLNLHRIEKETVKQGGQVYGKENGNSPETDNFISRLL